MQATRKRRKKKHTKRNMMLVLFFLSIAMHVSFLTTPRQVVFDEFHFGKFANAYCCKGARFFDIHPPHAKLMIAGMGKLFGYKGNYSFRKIGEEYRGPGIWGLRLIPALAGTILPILVFILLGQLGVASAGCFLGAFAILLENSLLVQSRVIGLDLIMVSAMIGSLSALIAYMRASAPVRRALMLALSGILSGLAVGTKFTGLAAPALLVILIWYVTAPIRTRQYKPALKMIGGVGAYTIGVYLIGWALHFHLLPKPGTGDLFYQPKGVFLKDTTEIHKRMLATNVKLNKKHQDGSKWWLWPLMKKPIYYWNDGPQRIYFLGNPVVWWGSTFFFIGLLCFLLLRNKTGLNISMAHPSAKFLWIPVLGFLISFIPYAFIERVMFMYHYLTALVFAVIACTLWFDSLGWIHAGGLKVQKRGYFVLLGSILLGFLLVSPLSYGFISFDWHHAILRYLFVVL